MSNKKPSMLMYMEKIELPIEEHSRIYDKYDDIYKNLLKISKIHYFINYYAFDNEYTDHIKKLPIFFIKITFLIKDMIENCVSFVNNFKLHFDQREYDEWIKYMNLTYHAFKKDLSILYLQSGGIATRIGKFNVRKRLERLKEIYNKYMLEFYPFIQGIRKFLESSDPDDLVSSGIGNKLILPGGTGQLSKTPPKKLLIDLIIEHLTNIIATTIENAISVKQIMENPEIKMYSYNVVNNALTTEVKKKQKSRILFDENKENPGKPTRLFYLKNTPENYPISGGNEITN